MPEFAVIVPAYNAAKTLGETLRAVEAQTYSDWQCVVVDDGSQDRTFDIANDFAQRDSRFSVVQQVNMGSAGAYNTGVGAAGADLLVICAADDVLLPEHLETMAKLVADHPACGIYSCNGLWWYEDGSTAVVYQDGPWLEERSLTLTQVIDACFFSVGATFRRSTFDTAGGLRVGVYCDDYDFWLRAMALGITHYYTPRVLAVHRITPTQQSANVRRVYSCDIDTYARLVEDGHLSGTEVSAAVQSMNVKRDALRSLEKTERLDRVRARFRPLLGVNGTERLVQFGLAVRRRLLRRSAG